ncbi:MULTISPECIES: LysR family transcriptional regulator [Oscillospiraceae]|uniref:LysR family transcriptional regulator n=1 Tax=Lawsonibacter faecis TaxID=2763052 RepID=A0A8J6MH21_9FIRM|nr:MULTISPECIES: LysR family transcriptional regulator [Oscillospiraceae]MTQ96889.1 LysR family transcriptional regulator [Pseudoflavonifractor sp. BIOML-A16]MTR05018.1 LysR family transcriptional regulator [Pseudoflavonifractor sp. BIOML-A15]MTR30735.1 LysR family transcriptional regulator [Pseudoflavonifractor sp. BIOML-A14]MTR72033.1 LysR family transcriptional regulator [Pseudoflavonifractor sp. BIOML-A18]MTS63557.1 LysR family transcriptional regulator [Pseudoflavonifractor sp. BIOML-A5]
MNLRHLEILEAVAQTGTFTGAAQKLYLTQSAVSHAVAELERQAGTALFDRLPRGVRLTPGGALLLEESQGVLTSFRDLEARMDRLEERAPVKLVSSITIASFWLPKILRSLRLRLPDLQIQVRVVSAARAIGLMRRGDADLALIEGAEPAGAFLSAAFGSYRLWAACAPDFQLPARALTPQELCALPLLLRETGSAIRDRLDSALYLANQTARPVWESVNSAALISAAAAGLGVTVLPDLLLSEPVGRGQLRVVALEGISLENEVLAVRHKSKVLTRSLAAVLEEIGVSL